MNRPVYLNDSNLSEFIRSALAEDVGEGDHSTRASVPASVNAKAKLLVKEDGVVAGLELAERIFHQVDKNLIVHFYKRDGETIKTGEVAFEVAGSAASILTSERLVLNCMQRMSGIATYTARLCKIVEGTQARIMDTRKTTPNFRLLEKWAVSIGGGKNHRFALYDMIMLKDNHVDVAGGIAAALNNAKGYLKTHAKQLQIEIETRTIQEVKEVIDAGGADVIMLDNMSMADMKEAVQLINGRYKTEASGGITERNLRQVAECGVDYISIGALTHSVKSLDLSLKIMK